jgi:hypothetical protein
MGGYIFFGNDGKLLWSLNLSGAIVWYGLLEELFPERLQTTTLEQHNFGFRIDAAAYRSLAQACIDSLRLNEPLPKGTDDYRRRHGEDAVIFKKDAIRLFEDSLTHIPPEGAFFAVDDLETDWWEEPCECETCRTEGLWHQIRRWYFGSGT